MRNFTLLALFIALNFVGLQAQDVCGTMEHLQHLKDKDPAAAKIEHKTTQRLNEWVRLHGEQYRAGGIITIPVVFHVVYSTPAQNIPDSYIQSQLDGLNADFRRLNADTTNTPAAFDSLMADCQIEFCLAQRDPNGDPTTGILRIPTAIPNFGGDDGVKFDSTGGSDAWPRDQYLNFWVCNLATGLLGYAQFPSQAAATDGVVVDYEYVGAINPATPNSQGRVATHEIGHWLNLRHIWGDDGGTCTGSDQVADTPDQGGNSMNCPSFPRTDNCSPNAPGIMFMNYMDYTDGACMNGFTQGQATRMQGTLATDRQTIPNSNGCMPVSLQAIDAKVNEITAPTGISCATTITPEFILFNRGMDTLFSLDINWQLNAGPVQTQAWTGALPSIGTEVITLPVQNISPGTYDLTIYTSNPNGTNDDDPTNDTLTATFTIQNIPTGIAPPIAEDFESSTFPPNGWVINNYDNDDTWELSTNAGANGSGQSTRMNYYDYPAPGQRDDLVLPVVDFSLASWPNITFDLSYRLYSFSGFSDTLKVEVTTDCGDTWTVVYEKYDQALTTVVPYFSSSPWTPNLNDHWRNEFVDLSAYAGMIGVQARFVGVNDYENNLYLDNINILGFVGVENRLSDHAVTLSPNPGHDLYRLEINLPQISEVDITVLNAVGQQVWQTKREDFTQGRIDLNLQGEATGIYFVRVQTSSGSLTRKLIRQ